MGRVLTTYPSVKNNSENVILDSFPKGRTESQGGD